MIKLIALTLTLLVSGPAIAKPAAIEGRAPVLDGDTIAVEGTAPHIRLFAIDAPENAQLCYDAADKRYLCGSRAAEALADIIGRNGRVSCTEKDRDRYECIVAVCFAEAVDISREMVRHGWAVEYKKYSDDRYTQVEAEAKTAKRGLWEGRFDEPSVWRHRKKTLAPPLVVPPPVQFAGTRAATSCKSATTCQEAVILWCGGYSRADGDGDGIPCENVCKSLEQVKALKKDAGCAE